MVSDTLLEDLLANAVLGIGIVLVVCCRDLCKRVAHSDCVYDAEHGGLRLRLPTWREPTENPIELQ